MDEALRVGNLTRADLAWERAAYRDRWLMPLILRAMETPIEASSQVLEFQSGLGTQSPTEVLRALESQAFGSTWRPEPVPDAIDDPAEGLPEPIRPAVLRIAKAIVLANSEVREAIAPLSAEDQRALVESLPQWALEVPGTKFDFVQQEARPWVEVLSLIQKIDLPRIRAAAANLSRTVDSASTALREGAKNVDLPAPLVLKVAGIPVSITGKGSDLITANGAMLMIDLGGHDRYEGRLGLGVRYVSVLLDLGGDDRYEPQDLSLGAGILGVGITRDYEGDDVYETGHLSLGSGLAGVGIFVDSEGNDTYRGKTLGQGFGIFGVGFMLDGSGDDAYDVALYGQGSGRTAGVGLLVDRAGRDTYRAGGFLLNSPLFSDVHYSFSQGFGSGYREDTGGTSGGVGMLTDLSGDDTYIGETYCQGASYWYGLGSLLDAAGHDTYTAYHYAQSSAMHACAAMLFDLAGDDAYAVKFGAAQAIGHDYGVAVLLDRAGNDVYASRDSIPGTGNANGLGIVLDVDGSDRYAGAVSKGNAARGTGSLGLFVDGNGPDKFGEGMADGGALLGPSWGVALDFPTKAADPAATPTRVPRPTPGTLPVPDAAEMERIYAKASQWSVGTAQKEVDENLARLVGIGLPAVQWMLDKKLASATRLHVRAFADVLRDVGPEAEELLAVKVEKGSRDEKRVGLMVAIEGGFRAVGRAVPNLIQDPELQATAVRAAGTLKSVSSVSALLPLTRQKGATGLAAMVSLAQIGDEQAYSTAEALLPTANLLTRKAAISLLSQFPRRATDTARALMLESEERRIRLGVELLAAVGTPEALTEIASRLLDPMPGVRAEAILALNGRCPADARLTFMSLRNDPDPLVRGLAQRADPGR